MRYLYLISYGVQAKNFLVLLLHTTGLSSLPLVAEYYRCQAACSEEMSAEIEMSLISNV
jgi:hypothetical protein